MASGSQFYDGYRDLFEFDKCSTLTEQSKVTSIISQADNVVGAYSPTREAFFSPGRQNQHALVVERGHMGGGRDANPGTLEDPERELEHEVYLKKVGKVEQRWSSYDNLISKGVDNAHNTKARSNAMYGSPKRNLGKRLVGVGVDAEGEDAEEGTHAKVGNSVPLPKIKVPNLGVMMGGKPQSNSNAVSSPQGQDPGTGASRGQNIQPTPPTNQMSRLQKQHVTTSPMTYRFANRGRKKDKMGEFLQPDTAKIVQGASNFHYGKRQIKPRVSPRVQTNVLPLDVEPAVIRPGKMQMKPVLTSRNEVNRLLWRDLRNNPSAKPTAGMFNPDLPSRKKLELPGAEEERLDFVKKTRFLLKYCGGKAFTGYETDMPAAVVNRLDAYRKLNTRREQLKALYAKDVAQQKKRFERRVIW